MSHRAGDSQDISFILKVTFEKYELHRENVIYIIHLMSDICMSYLILYLKIAKSKLHHGECTWIDIHKYLRLNAFAR